MDTEKHQVVLLKILKEIYSNATLRNALGFKGGTAAYFFYNLPRFSVDLDFDLLSVEKKDEVFEELKKILPRFGEVLDSSDKRFTIFFLLRYELHSRLIKIEISKRKTSADYQLKHYLGIPIMVMQKQDMVVGKLSAFLTRRKFASRDLFDLWFFLKDQEKIHAELVKEHMGLTLKEALIRARKKVVSIKKNQLLQGVGELLTDKQKNWVREKLKDETLFYLDIFLKQKATKKEQLA